MQMKQIRTVSLHSLQLTQERGTDIESGERSDPAQTGYLDFFIGLLHRRSSTQSLPGDLFSERVRMIHYQHFHIDIQLRLCLRQSL